MIIDSVRHRWRSQSLAAGNRSALDRASVQLGVGGLTIQIRLPCWYHWTMDRNETVVLVGPRTDYADVVVAALNDEAIPARIVAIDDVSPEQRPVCADESACQIYVVVPHAKREASLEVISWVSRVCLNCETSLMPKVNACQKCGTPHLMVPGPFSISYPTDC